MHSKFISNLFDPKAQHGQKSRFLNLFIKHVKLDFIIENIIIKTEMSANKRRIDITIANSNSIIIIENKIWAKDQNCQLEDYYNFCKDKYKNVDLIYLTPYATSPSDCSLGENLKINKVKVNHISYEKIIIPWIEECIVESNGRLKASLEMYNEILHKLINSFKNVLFFDHNQISTRHPDVPIEEWAKTKYAKLANLSMAESERLSDDAIYIGHNGVIPDPGLLSIRERFEKGDELFYSIFKRNMFNPLPCFQNILQVSIF